MRHRRPAAVSFRRIAALDAGRPAAVRRLLLPAVALVVAVSLFVAGCTGKSDEKSVPQGSWTPVGPTNAVIRVDQVGYATDETKVALLLAPDEAAGSDFVIERPDGSVAARGKVGASMGDWNDKFPDAYPLDVSTLRTAGTYRIRVTGKVSAVSPVFAVGAARELFGEVAADTVKFFTLQRDGTHVASETIPRVASHQNDAHATVYQAPDLEDGDNLAAAPTPAEDGAKTVDVEGGWYDAGDYLKFTQSTAYALVDLLLAQRGGDTIGNGPDVEGLSAESRFGLDWLDKMWDETTKTLYLQVGLGSGGADGIVGDHDLWRLPQLDDAATGDAQQFIRNRPVFRANEPGGPISPNLAGRVAAAFALAAQVEAGDQPARARAHLEAAAAILTLANTDNPGELVTTYPHSYYSESSWADDMALGTTELARAGLVLGDGRAATWANQAGHFAKLSADQGNLQPLNLYDVGPLADAELIGLVRETKRPVAEVTEQTLLADLRARLDSGVKIASNSPIGAAAALNQSDFTSRTFGWSAVASLYGRLAGDDTYAAFGTAQRNIALGTNGWGLSLVVGVGTTFPRCLHHQIANLAGDLDGQGLIATGAVVNGPNAASAFTRLTATSSAHACQGVDVSRYDRSDSRFVDQPYAYASTEPAIDFTATALLALTLTARQ